MKELGELTPANGQYVEVRVLVVESEESQTMRRLWIANLTGFAINIFFYSDSKAMFYQSLVLVILPMMLQMYYFYSGYSKKQYQHTEDFLIKYSYRLSIFSCLVCIVLMTLMCITAIEKVNTDRKLISCAPSKLIKTWELMFMAESFWLELTTTITFMCNFYFIAY